MIHRCFFRDSMPSHDIQRFHRMTNTTEDSTYESLYVRMQAIVARLEAGQLPLDEALALYEEGVAVAAACQRLLDQAELRIQELSPGAGAQPSLWEE
jgi:exodeoxyribonuclease VII small subunit